MPKTRKRENKAFKVFSKNLGALISRWPEEARAWLDICYELSSHKN